VFSIYSGVDTLRILPWQYEGFDERWKEAIISGWIGSMNKFL